MEFGGFATLDLSFQPTMPQKQPGELHGLPNMGNDAIFQRYNIDRFQSHMAYISPNTSDKESGRAWCGLDRSGNGNSANSFRKERDPFLFVPSREQEFAEFMPIEADRSQVDDLGKFDIKWSSEQAQYPMQNNNLSTLLHSGHGYGQQIECLQRYEITQVNEKRVPLYSEKAKNCPAIGLERDSIFCGTSSQDSSQDGIKKPPYKKREQVKTACSIKY